MEGCTNPAHQYLHLAPIACPSCRGWLDRDGSVIGTEEMLRRYPQMRTVVGPRQNWPDYTPSRSDQFFTVNRLVGQLAKTLLLIMLALIALALVVACTAAVA